MADSTEHRGLERLADAAANRTREGLRLLEDIARFVLDDAALCADLKQARHGVTQAMSALARHAPSFGPAGLTAWRDTPGDVGTAVKTREEIARHSTLDAAGAGAGRAAEGLRSLCEVAKIVGGAEAASALEALRYRVYDLHTRLAKALGAGERRQWRLCVLITQSECRRAWEDVAQSAAAGGADCLQLREKSLDGRELLARARRLVDIAHRRGAAAIINDRPDIALLSGADGVHVGQEDLPIDEVRRLCGSRLIVGVSTSNFEQAGAAASAGADYCGVGPMFATTTKTKPVLAGVAYLREYLADERTRRTPHLAIGGVNASNASELAAAGARGVAVCAAVCKAPDPGLAAAEIIEALARVEAR